ncbi:MAG: hypothetical protein WCL16_09390, partial [bacterium]
MLVFTTAPGFYACPPYTPSRIEKQLILDHYKRLVVALGGLKSYMFTSRRHQVMDCLAVRLEQ